MGSYLILNFLHNQKLMLIANKLQVIFVVVKAFNYRVYQLGTNIELLYCASQLHEFECHFCLEPP